jgi:hypothetical protein
VALDEILYCRLAFARGLEANDERRIRKPVGFAAFTPFAVDAKRLALLARLLATGGQFLGRQVAAISGAARQQLVGDFGVTGFELGLVIGMAVELEAKPGESVVDDVDRFLGRARLVGILDPQQRFAAAMARVEPREQPRAGVADMQESGRRGREAGDDRSGFGTCAQALSPRIGAMRP